MDSLLELQISVYLCREGRVEERKEYSLWIIYYRFTFVVYEAIHIFYPPGILCLSLNSLSLFLDCKILALYV